MQNNYLNHKKIYKTKKKNIAFWIYPGQNWRTRHKILAGAVTRSSSARWLWGTVAKWGDECTTEGARRTHNAAVARRRPQQRSDGGATVARRRPQRELDGGATVARRWPLPFRRWRGGCLLFACCSVAEQDRRPKLRGWRRNRRWRCRWRRSLMEMERSRERRWWTVRVRAIGNINRGYGLGSVNTRGRNSYRPRFCSTRGQIFRYRPRSIDTRGQKVCCQW